MDIFCTLTFCFICTDLGTIHHNLAAGWMVGPEREAAVYRDEDGAFHGFSGKFSIEEAEKAGHIVWTCR